MKNYTRSKLKKSDIKGSDDMNKMSIDFIESCKFINHTNHFIYEKVVPNEFNYSFGTTCKFLDEDFYDIKSELKKSNIIINKYNGVYIITSPMTVFIKLISFFFFIILISITTLLFMYALFITGVNLI